MSDPITPSTQPQSLLTLRDYRKGNWTVQETLTLITAKRLDDDRRSAASSSTSRSAEQRWKWVENYCWNHDCLRSQNQCNDKWDNLLRDYKKVRDYEAKISSTEDTSQTTSKSYWGMERHERKERNLPTNMSLEVYETLADVLSRRNARRSSTSATPTMMLPPPPPPLLPPPEALPQATTQTEGSGDVSVSDESETDEPDTKRRKVKSLGSSMVRSASVLAQTLMACEEKREQRHRDLLELEERKVKLEEERSEMNKQAVSGLISAVNGLSNAIHALVSDHHRHGDSSHM